jgi:hypothetical protein
MISSVSLFFHFQRLSVRAASWDLSLVHLADPKTGAILCRLFLWINWWGFPFFSLSASRNFGEKETLCLYWPLRPIEK